MKNMFNQWHHEIRGQAIVEFCVVAPVIIMMIWAVVYISDVFMLKQQLLAASRYGAWKLAKEKNISYVPDSLRQSIIDNFFPGENDRVKVAVDLQGESETKGVMGLLVDGVDWILCATKKVMSDADRSRVGLKVSYRKPVKLGNLNISNDPSKNYLVISSSHFVDRNTWDRDSWDEKKGVYEPGKLMWETVKEAFEGALKFFK